MSFQEKKEMLDLRPLPDEFYRGVDTENDYDNEINCLKKSVFQFKPNPNGLRQEMDECSINWDDDINAVDGLKNRYGYVVIPLKWFSETGAVAQFIINLREMGLFDFGRDCIEDNYYHGNLYIKKEISKSHRESIQQYLIMISSDSFVLN